MLERKLGFSYVYVTFLTLILINYTNTSDSFNLITNLDNSFINLNLKKEMC